VVTELHATFDKLELPIFPEQLSDEVTPTIIGIPI
jgi:hypothetical protein